MFLIPGSRPCAGSSRPGSPGRLRAPHWGCKAAAPRRAPQPWGPTEGPSPQLHRDPRACGGLRTPKRSLRRGVGSGCTHGCLPVGGRLQPHAEVWVRPREHSRTPLLPADAVFLAVFLAPAKDTPAAHRPPGVWHSHASAVSRQQPPPGAQCGSTTWATGWGFNPRGDSVSGTCSNGASVQMCRAHVFVCSSLMHEPSCAGVGLLDAGVQGAGCARGWCARSRLCKGLARSRAVLWAHIGPTGVTGGLRHCSSHRGGCCLTHPALRGLCWQHWGAPGPTRPHPPAFCLWHRSAGQVRVTLCCAVRLKANICPEPAAEAQCEVCCAQRPWAAPQGAGEGHRPIWVMHGAPLQVLHTHTSPSCACRQTHSICRHPLCAHLPWACTHTHTCTAAHTHTHTG